MKFEIFNWAGERKVKDVLAQLGYEHGQMIDGDINSVFDVAKKFYSASISVMIMPLGNGTTLLALDTKSFGQR